MAKYIIYGAGHDGIITMKYLGMDNIDFFCDSQKSGTIMYGIPVFGFDKLKDEYRNHIVILAVSTPAYIIEISKMLFDVGIEFIFWKEAVKEIIRKEGSLYNSINRNENFKYDTAAEYIITEDKYSDAGRIGSYFWQDLWAARHIIKERPEIHYDIGSRIDGFIAHLLSAGQRVRVIDIRPLKINVPGLEFRQADATNMDGVEDESIDSLSALCSLEHFGLGRYGDQIDPDACFNCFDAIQRKMKKGGRVYISVPVGKEHLEFNAHRVFYPETIKKVFDKCELREFSVAYYEKFEENVNINAYDDWTEKGGELFGLFYFIKE